MGTSVACGGFNIGGFYHPHAYGDKWMDEDDVFGDTGSSPRVWGQAIFVRSRKWSDGIIPTRMGTRLSLDFAKRTG